MQKPETADDRLILFSERDQSNKPFPQLQIRARWRLELSTRAALLCGECLGRQKTGCEMLNMDECPAWFQPK